MRQSSQQRLIDRFVEATGRTDCTQIVVLQRRPPWAMFAVAGLVVVAVLVLRLFADPGALVTGAIVGAVVGIPLTFLMTGHWLARCGESVVLVQVGRRLAGPHTVVGEWSLPVDATVGRGLAAKRVNLQGESYILSFNFVREFRAITGTA